MNLNRLKQAESAFFAQYPGGFDHPDMIKIGKKHKMPTMIDFAQQAFSKVKFKDETQIVADLSTLVNRSSLISLFDKPKFKRFVESMALPDKMALSDALFALIHGNQEHGFNQLVEILAEEKLANWPLVTLTLCYFSPQKEVFLKPTTVKGVISFFELTDLTYKSKPSWNFYQTYRKHILSMRDRVSKNLAPNTAAFCGFLMMSIGS